MNRRAAALAAAAALLGGCAALLPASIVVSEAELQAQLQRRFPLQRSLLDSVDLELADPRVRLDASAQRIATELTLRGSERRSGRGLQGRLALDYALRYERADASVRLVQPRVQSLQFDEAPGLSGRRAESLQRIGLALAERLLDDLVLYRVPPQRLERLRRAGVQPGVLQVTPEGLEITLELLAP
ncbi:MAG TPA: DUF1439 domain-containing protein [Rubrivivax sp.]|nr:DUF1439 domain-containing protein [Rubrivivax sp.]